MSRRRGGCGGCFFRLLLAAFVLAMLAAGGLAYLIYQPYKGFTEPAVVDIPRGTSTSSIGQQLAASRVIHYPWQFQILRAVRSSAKLQAGEYQFTRAASAWTVFDRLVRGDVFFYELTIPEGHNMFDIAKSVDQLKFIKGSDFLRIARSPALIHDLAPDAPSLEGYLFPSTYRLTRHTTAAQLCRQMTDLFRRRWQELQPVGRATKKVNETVTLASLIEKESGVPEERPKVASVYLNRLRLGMALDCDPTTIYAALLENRYRGTIHKSDLESASAYNTYRHGGLPPGPIASPGLASLQAALTPANTDYLYFVARGDGSGGHNFAKTLAEHSRNVALYRRAQ
ncbi:MAG: endolytic transglycosylase MltG [Bryobacteraceae bacterium]